MFKALRLIFIIGIIANPLYANEVIDWSANAATQLLGFSYTDNEKEYWNKYKNIFTQSGWNKFINDLNASHNIKTINDLKLKTYIKTNNEKARITYFNKKTKVILPAIITYAGIDIASFYPAEISITIGESNKIEKLVVTQQAEPKSHAIYPRGCHLRKYN